MSTNTTQIHPDTPQTSPKHPSDISRELKMSTDDNMHQQTPPNILKQHLSVSEGVWGCLLASVVVCWHLDFPGDVWGMSEGYLRGVYRYFSGSHGNPRCSDLFWRYLGSPSLQYGAVTLSWHSPERCDFFT